MTSMKLWAIDFIEQHPTVSLADYYEQDVQTNQLGFLPHRPSLVLMTLIESFVASRSSHVRRKIPELLDFEEWPLPEHVEPSRFSLRETSIPIGFAVLDVDYGDDEGALTRVEFTYIDGLLPLSFDKNSLEARLCYAVFDLFHQQVMATMR